MASGQVARNPIFVAIFVSWKITLQQHGECNSKAAREEKGTANTVGEQRKRGGDGKILSELEDDRHDTHNQPYQQTYPDRMK